MRLVLAEVLRELFVHFLHVFETLGASFLVFASYQGRAISFESPFRLLFGCYGNFAVVVVQVIDDPDAILRHLCEKYVEPRHMGNV